MPISEHERGLNFSSPSEQPRGSERFSVKGGLIGMAIAGLAVLASTGLEVWAIHVMTPSPLRIALEYSAIEAPLSLLGAITIGGLIGGYFGRLNPVNLLRRS